MRSRSKQLIAFVMASFMIGTIFQSAGAYTESTGATYGTGGSSGGGWSTVWTGNAAYIFGTRTYQGAPTGDIIKYVPSTNVVAKVATMPVSLKEATAAWDGAFAYIFGGFEQVCCAGNRRYSDRIFRFDPVANTVVQMPTSMPGGRSLMAATWHGGYVYLFGGWSPIDGSKNDVLRYDPVSGSLEVLSMRMPVQGGLLAAQVVSVEGRYFVVGGFGYPNGGYAPSGAVLEFDPVDLTITQVANGSGIGHTAGAVWNGKEVLYFGGQAVAAFDPYGSTITRLTSTLPEGATGAIFDEGNTYVFVESGNILRFDRRAAEPTDIKVGVSDQPGSLLVSWTPPLDMGNLPILGYRIYRSFLGNELLAGQVGDTNKFSDGECPDPTACSYRISTLNRDGEGRPSRAATILTNPGTSNSCVVGSSSKLVGTPAHNGQGNSCSYKAEGPGFYATSVPAFWCVNVWRDNTLVHSVCPADPLAFDGRLGGGGSIGFLPTAKGDVVQAWLANWSGREAVSLALIAGDRPSEATGNECMTGFGTTSCSYTATRKGQYHSAGVTNYCIKVTRGSTTVQNLCANSIPTGTLNSSPGDVVTVTTYPQVVSPCFQAYCMVPGVVRAKDV